MGMMSRANVKSVAPPDPVKYKYIRLSVWISFIKIIQKVAIKNPIIKEPVSPMKILAGDKL